MSLEQSLREVAAALASLPSVSVEEIAFPPAQPAITFTVGNLDSLGVIVYSAMGANIPLDLWTVAPGRPIAARASGKCIRYRLTLSEIEPVALSDSLMNLGCYLVWYLYDAGILAREEANANLEKWGGALV